VGLAFADMRDGAESIAEKELDVVEDAERECDAEAEYVDVAEREEDGIAEKDGAECCKEE
jgi:hypothetical protein